MRRVASVQNHLRVEEDSPAPFWYRHFIPWIRRCKSFSLCINPCSLTGLFCFLQRIASLCTTSITSGATCLSPPLAVRTSSRDNMTTPSSRICKQMAIQTNLQTDCDSDECGVLFLPFCRVQDVKMMAVLYFHDGSRAYEWILRILWRSLSCLC